MKVLITLLGRSGWGLFNSVWAMIRTHDYVPEKIYHNRRLPDAGRGTGQDDAGSSPSRV